MYVFELSRWLIASVRVAFYGDRGESIVIYVRPPIYYAFSLLLLLIFDAFYGFALKLIDFVLCDVESVLRARK